jgi:DNA invertase Pin-like site-specific DNA recombinase
MRQIFGAIAQMDKSNIVRKLRAARQRKRTQTGRCEGRKPYGFREGEPVVLARMQSLYSAGNNYEAIAKTLNSKHIKTRSGGEWYPATVRRILLAAQTKNLASQVI